MDPLTCVFWIAFALIMLGIALHPGFGVLGYAVMIGGTLWVTR